MAGVPQRVMSSWWQTLFPKRSCAQFSNFGFYWDEWGWPLWCLGSPYAETYREFIAFTTKLYDEVPSFQPPTLSHLPSSLHISLSACVRLRLCALLPLLSRSLSHLVVNVPFIFLPFISLCVLISLSVSLCSSPRSFPNSLTLTLPPSPLRLPLP